jgi:hypothetical protein
MLGGFKQCFKAWNIVSWRQTMFGRSKHCSRRLRNVRERSAVYGVDRVRNGGKLVEPIGIEPTTS